MIWEDAFEGFGEKMEEFGQRMETLEGRRIRIEGASYSRKSHAKPCPPKPSTPAERYESYSPSYQTFELNDVSGTAN